MGTNNGATYPKPFGPCGNTSGAHLHYEGEYNGEILLFSIPATKYEFYEELPMGHVMVNPIVIDLFQRNGINLPIIPFFCRLDIVISSITILDWDIGTKRYRPTYIIRKINNIYEFLSAGPYRACIKKKS
jgi:hypothetical protein